MIVEQACGPAFRAVPGCAFIVTQKNMNFVSLDFQINVMNAPGLVDTKDLLVKLTILNGDFPPRRASVKLPAAWAEARAMLGSNPSADSGTKTEPGCRNGTPLPSLSLPRDLYKSVKSRGCGGRPPQSSSTTNPEFPKSKKLCFEV